MVSKAWLYLWCILLVLGCSVTKSESKHFDQIELRPNYQLNYNIAAGGERYQFIVDIKKVTPYRTFKFTMTNKNETSAFITITPQALDSGNVEKNYFPGYEDTLANNQLTVWFSKRMLRELLTQDSTKFDGHSSGWGTAITTYHNEGFESFY